MSFDEWSCIHRLLTMTITSDLNVFNFGALPFFYITLPLPLLLCRSGLIWACVMSWIAFDSVAVALFGSVIYVHKNTAFNYNKNDDTLMCIDAYRGLRTKTTFSEPDQLLSRFPYMDSGATFSIPAFSTTALRSHAFNIRVSHSRAFSAPQTYKYVNVDSLL